MLELYSSSFLSAGAPTDQESWLRQGGVLTSIRSSDLMICASPHHMASERVGEPHGFCAMISVGVPCSSCMSQGSRCALRFKVLGFRQTWRPWPSRSCWRLGSRNILDCQRAKISWNVNRGILRGGPQNIRGAFPSLFLMLCALWLLYCFRS